MRGVNLVALAERHIPAVVEACADWRELSAYGLPYWRPRSTAELLRKIAAIAVARNALLLTANRRDFELIPGLRFASWLD